MRTILVVGLFSLISVLGSGTSPGAEQAQVRITRPTQDAIVLERTVDVSGTSTAEDGAAITLEGGTGGPLEAEVQGGRWSATGVRLRRGLNILTATVAGGGSHSVTVNRGRGIGRRPRQQVLFVWDQGIDNELRAIARGTLDAQLSPAQLNAFVAGVRAQTVLAFSRAYRGVGVDLVQQGGAGVHTIRMMVDQGDIFGQSFFDCGNLNTQQTSEVWVGTYRRSMVNNFGSWRPMDRADTLRQRIVDVGEALGRTSAHELGHSLGLVGSDLDGNCGWMLGCDGGHNCDLIDEQFEPTNRFDNGNFIMDPGGKTLNNIRIAEPSPNFRSARRQPAVFNRFDRSYFRIVLP